MRKYVQPLKIFSLILAGVGIIVSQELQRRETEEIVEKAIAKREAEAARAQIEQ